MSIFDIGVSMKKRWNHTVGWFVVLALTQTHALSAQDAREIVRRADQHVRGESSIAQIEMTIKRPSWQRSILMKAWTKGNDYSLIRILSPARDAGTAFLKRKNEIWNWLPGIDRTIKLPPSMMMQSWMGSDFTNDDLVRESSAVNDYYHTLLGDSIVNGLPCHKIQMIPKPDAPVVWSKLIVWITKTDYLQLRVEFYDERGKKINLMTGSDIKMIGGRKLPARMEMVPLDKKGHATIMIYKSIEFNKPLRDDFFSISQLKKG